MSITKEAKADIKQESLRKLAEKTGINLTNYSIPVIGYEKIDYVKWQKELREKEERDAKERERQWKTAEKGYFKGNPCRQLIFRGRGYEVASQKFGGREKYDFIRVRNINIQRSFLWGKGNNEHIWIEPLSRGILLSLAQAQETKQFERFEIWKPVFGIDPILVGFTGWNNSWSPNAYGFELNDCNVTYKICAWEE